MRVLLMALAVGVLLAPALGCANDLDSRLLDAARTGDVAAVDSLLRQGAAVNAVNRYGATALILASAHNHLDVVDRLVAAGADLDHEDTFYGASALSWAASNRHAKAVERLLTAGAAGAGEALRWGVSRDSPEVVQAALESGKAAPEAIAQAKLLARMRGSGRIQKLLDEASDVPAASVAAPAEALRPYLGDYETESGRQTRVRLQDGELLVGDTPVVAAPGETHTFRHFNAAYRFSVAADAATQFIYHAGPQQVVYTRAAPAGEAPTQDEAPQEADPLVLADGHWPQFRGREASGNGDGQNPPATWDAAQGKNVRWRTPIPGLAHSSPIVWEDQVFVTTAVRREGEAPLRAGLYGDVDPVEDPSEFSFRLYCLDKRSGKVLWERTAHEGVPRIKRHPKASHANATPATDGRRILASFGSEGLWCYRVDGELLWKRDLGSLDSGWFYDRDYQWGFASSPILWRGLAIVQCDVQDQSFLAAFDAETGEQVWRTLRDEIPSWATPTVFERNGKAVLATAATNRARGYDPATGEPIWSLAEHSQIAVPTPIASKSLIFISSGYRPIRPIYALRFDARGTLDLPAGQSSSEQVAWSVTQGGPYIPTPILYGAYLYVCTDEGVLTCYQAATGRRVYRHRLRSGEARSFSASPVAADGRLYFTAEEGATLVVKAGPKFELLHTNPLGELCLATPAISDGLFIVRTQGHVMALGE